MSFGISPYVLGFGASFGASLLLTPAVRAIARRVGWVAKPRADRWHARPTALMGGLAIVAAFLVALGMGEVAHVVTHGRLLVVCALTMAVLGFVDDRIQLRPYTKLIGQLVAAIAMTSFGLAFPWTPWLPVNQAITIFWLVGVTNALNLLDNIDGLSSGIAAIAALFLAVLHASEGQVSDAFLCLSFAGSVLGFLVYNFNPASIFMGDSGSLFLGFFLGGAALYAPRSNSGGVIGILAPPVLLLAIPILDTTLVTITRKLNGRPVSQGGRDHASHRLVALGLSERNATLVLYALALAAGGIAILMRVMPESLTLAALPVVALAVLVIGIYLARVRVYTPVAEVTGALETRALIPTFSDFTYKRRIFEVVADYTLILLAYYGAFLLRFDGELVAPHWVRFRASIPLVTATQLLVFLAAGIYGGIWRYTGLRDIRRLALTVVAATAAGALVAVFATGELRGFSRVVFVIDGLLLFFGTAALRFSFRLLHDEISARRQLPDHKRVLIYGAGDGGEFLARALLNNADLAMKPVGFIDDDPNKEGRVVHGLAVLGSYKRIGNFIESFEVTEILVSTRAISDDRAHQITALAATLGARVRRARWVLEDIVDGTPPPPPVRNSDGDVR